MNTISSTSTGTVERLANQESLPILIMEIFARRDLNMRKGKLAAQVAHAACAQLLNSMDDFGGYRVLSALNYQRLLQLISHEAVVIKMVAGEADLLGSLENPELSTVITDRGLTEFGGVPTVTTAAQGVFTPSAKKAVPLDGADLIARQWFVFSKQQPLPKEVAAKMAAIGCLTMMASLLKPLEGASDGSMKLCLSDPALRGWLTAGFGKIGMGIKTDDDLVVLQETLDTSNVHYVGLDSGVSKLLVIGPEFPERMATLTGKESDLYTAGKLTLL
jgi:peptidyl-tRNA hydrolase